MNNKTLEQRTREKSLRKQHRNNELNRYCRAMDYALEVGFYYKEAKSYAVNLLRMR